MKNDIPCWDKSDKHNEFILEFKPSEILKQFDVNINMGDCTYPSPISTCPTSDTDCCNTIFLLLLLAAIVIGTLNLPQGNNYLLVLLVALAFN